MTSQSYSPEQIVLPPAPEPEPEEKGSILEVLEKIGSFLVPVGVTLYALLYMGIKEMYAVFGINPEQAGIDQSVLLGRLLGTLIPLLIGLALGVGVLVGLGWLANVITRGWAGRAVQAIRKRPWIVATIAGLWAGLTYLGFLYLSVEVDGTALGDGQVLLAALLGVLAYAVPFRLLRRRPVGRAGTKVLLGALTGVGLGYVLVVQLVYGAADVQETGQANTLLDLVGFQDQWARLQDGDGKTLYDGRWMMLLGESDGTYSFYDCDRMETFRRSGEGTILTDVQLSPEREEGFTCGDLAKKE
ncbi:hypothetical protein ACFXJ8_24095 [Nonomuraea sp. NPDC059194]|uniref:hypothetical protein n=1 Tax=Nonomuraea sp. NPDC059194 TaxID=3346764 RepID=UPI0036A65A22